MALTTITSRAAAALVAAVAGFASYQHIYRVAITAGEHRSVSAVLPLAIDGLILVATLAMLDDKRNRRLPRVSARIALAFGVLATLAANIASAQPTVTARMVAAVPAVSFLLAVEVLARSGRPIPEKAEAAEATTEHQTEATAGQPVAREATAGQRIGREATAGQPVSAGEAPHRSSTRSTVPAEGVVSPEPAARRRTAQAPASAPAAAPPYTPDLRPRPGRARGKAPTAAQRVASAAATLPDGTVAQIAARAGVAESTARRYLTPAQGGPDGRQPVGPAPVDAAPVLNGHPVGA